MLFRSLIFDSNHMVRVEYEHLDLLAELCPGSERKRGDYILERGVFGEEEVASDVRGVDGVVPGFVDTVVVVGVPVCEDVEGGGQPKSKLVDDHSFDKAHSYINRVPP